MFQSVLVSGLTPLSNIKNEVDQWENKPFTTLWPDSQQKPKEPEIARSIIKKKKKRVRTAFTTDQLRALEKTFTRFKYVDSERRRELAAALNINEKTIKVWFQNRRMKEKRESSEASCDSSSETLNTTPPPYCSPMVDQVDSTSPHFYHRNSNEVLNINTPTNNSSNQQTYDQSCQPTTEYYNQAYQMPPPTNPAFVYDTNVYPTQYYEYPCNYSGHQYNQSYNEQNYGNWLQNFDSGY